MAMVALLVIYGVYVALALAPTELQIAVRYTAFGETQYYRDKWYYLLMFIGFAAVVAVVHIGLAIKLYLRDMRPLAVSLGWLGLLVFVLLFVITRNVLSVAYLS